MQSGALCAAPANRWGCSDGWSSAACSARAFFQSHLLQPAYCAEICSFALLIIIINALYKQCTNTGVGGARLRRRQRQTPRRQHAMPCCSASVACKLHACAHLLVHTHFGYVGHTNATQPPITTHASPLFVLAGACFPAPQPGLNRPLFRHFSVLAQAIARVACRRAGGRASRGTAGGHPVEASPAPASPAGPLPLPWAGGRGRGAPSDGLRTTPSGRASRGSAKRSRRGWRGAARRTRGTGRQRLRQRWPARTWR